IHQLYGWSELQTPCKIKTETKGPNVSILSAVSNDVIITLSQKKNCYYNCSWKRQ
ncbi:hypothetical protein BY458DRAFT_427398, partial [Sporodiniella umbellata]